MPDIQQSTPIKDGFGGNLIQPDAAGTLLTPVDQSTPTEKKTRRR
jgi:hypothetical protein